MLSSTKQQDDRLFRRFLQLFTGELEKEQSSFWSQERWNAKDSNKPQKSYLDYLEVNYFDLDHLEKFFLDCRYEFRRPDAKDLRKCLRLDSPVFENESREKIDRFLTAMSKSFQHAQRQLPEPTNLDYLFYKMRRYDLDLPDDPAELPQVFEKTGEFIRSLDQDIERVREAATIRYRERGGSIPIRPLPKDRSLVSGSPSEDSGSPGAYDAIRDLKERLLEVYDFLHLVQVKAEIFDVRLPENEFTPSPEQPTEPSKRQAQTEEELSQEEIKTQLEPIAKFPSPENLNWEEVNMSFVSNETLEIRARGVVKKYHYAQLGFKDRRQVDVPNRLWSLLKYVFASEDGEISAERTHIDWKLLKNVQKPISRLRHHLKEIMGIEDDPFYEYRKERAYRPKFSIRDQTLIGARPASAFRTNRRRRS